jgi:hypothetical protein
VSKELRPSDKSDLKARSQKLARWLEQQLRAVVANVVEPEHQVIAFEDRRLDRTQPSG